MINAVITISQCSCTKLCCTLHCIAAAEVDREEVCIMTQYWVAWHVLSGMVCGVCWQLALVVAQHRSRSIAVSGIQMSPLGTALSKLARFARANKGRSTLDYALLVYFWNILMLPSCRLVSAADFTSALSCWLVDRKDIWADKLLFQQSYGCPWRNQ